MAASTSVVEGLPFNEDKKKYIVDVLDPILEEMVSDLLTDMPKSPVDFMTAWMRKRSGTSGTMKESLQKQNLKLRQELKQMTGALEEASTQIGSVEEDNKEDEEEEDDECDEIPESFKKPEAQMGRARQSVSAEAYGQWNQKKEFTPPTHEKTEDQKQRLSAVLKTSFMFADMEPADMETILMAMKECKFTASTKVISEGEDGDYLFVIESGSLDCIKLIDGAEKVVKSCSPGDVFGELALLYNCPRAASVVSKEDSVCWQLDRETFTHIVKESAVRRREKYDNFLKSVTLISSIGAYERSQIADALKAETYKKGDVVVKQDEPGNNFYILEEGSLYAVKNIPGEGEKRVMDYKTRGDYFGELALLKNQPRAASVIVETETAKVLSMSRASFSKMLGPLQGLLAKQVASYS